MISLLKGMTRSGHALVSNWPTVSHMVVCMLRWAGKCSLQGSPVSCSMRNSVCKRKKERMDIRRTSKELHLYKWKCESLSCVLLLWPHGLYVARQAPLSWDSPGKNTGEGCRALSQGIFPTQGSSPCVSCTDRQVLYRLHHLGSPFWVLTVWQPLSCSLLLYLLLLLADIVYLLFVQGRGWAGREVDEAIWASGNQYQQPGVQVG